MSVQNYPSVAVVILNYNGRNYLEKFLPSVLASSYTNKKVIVADNASTDDSIAFLQQAFPLIEIIVLDKNYGFAGGYNKALAQVQSDYYVLLNSDVEVSPSWIEPIMTLMESNKNIAACQPKILAYHQKNLFEYAGASGGFIDMFGYPFARGRIFDDCEKDIHQYDNEQQVFWASGAAMFVRAEIFHKLNGLDAYFFAHMEEIDLCWRMQLAGYSIYCQPSSVVYHVGGGTLPKGNSKKVFLNFRNNLIMLLKNLPFREKLWKIPVRMFLDAAFAFKNLFSGYPASFIAVVKAYFALFHWRFTAKKKNQFAKKPLVSLRGTLNKSLVWAYFVKKKKSFSEIVDKNN